MRHNRNHDKKSLLARWSEPAFRGNVPQARVRFNPFIGLAKTSSCLSRMISVIATGPDKLNQMTHI